MMPIDQSQIKWDDETPLVVDDFGGKPANGPTINVDGATPNFDESKIVWDKEPRSQSARDAYARNDVNSSFGRLGDLIYGGVKGAADLVQGPAQLIINGAAKLSGNGPASQKVKDWASEYNDYLRRQEAQYQADTPDSFSAGLGRVAGGIAPFMVSGGSSSASQVPALLSQTPKILSRIPNSLTSTAKTSLQGGIYSASQPVTDMQNSINQDAGEEQNNFFNEKLKQGGLGAAFSTAAKPFASLAGRFINPNISQDVRTMLDSGVTPTIGQMMGGGWQRTEDKATSIPLIGDMIKNAQRRGVEQFNVAAQNRALNPFGDQSNGVIGREGLADVKNKLKSAYDDILPKLQFKADQQFSDEYANLDKLVNNGNMPPKIADQFNNIIKNNVFSRMTPQGAMDGKSFKELEESLSKDIKSYAGSQDPDQRKLGDALKEVLNSARNALDRANPAYAPQLDAINKGYANYARLRGASSMVGADGGVFTPAQLQSAVKAQDKSVGKGSFATGDALMQDLSEAGKNVLGSKYPDSGTAGRALLGGLAAGGAGGLTSALGFGAVNPWMAGLGIASMAPYTKLGQSLTATALARRPKMAGPLSSAIRSTAPIVGASFAPSLAQGSE